jgi:hypothetical protein
MVSIGTRNQCADRPGMGYFLWQGVRDPLGGINSLWPLFGISNQLLAAVALCVATTITIKARRARYALLRWCRWHGLWSLHSPQSWHKIFDPDPRIGFLAQARQIAAAGGNARLTFNNQLDAVVTAILVMMVTLLLVESARQWMAALSGRKLSSTTETPFVATRLVERTRMKGLRILHAILREIFEESAYERFLRQRRFWGAGVDPMRSSCAATSWTEMLLA